MSASQDARGVHLWISGLSNVGRQRTNNQDSMLAADLSLHLDRGGVADPIHEFGIGNSLDVHVGPKGFLMMVADGMGGARAGEVASRMAVNGIHEELVTNWVAEPDPTAERFGAELVEAVREANRRIYEAAQLNEEYRGMGTTVTAGGVLGDVVYVAQVGDSRAYLIRDGEAVQLSRDQSVVEHLVRAGKLTPLEAERSERKNVLLQAMGTGEDVDVDLSFQTLRQGDVLLFCSDGLTGTVTAPELSEIVGLASDPSIACSELVALANARGGSDNITILVAKAVGDALAESRDGDPVGYAAFPVEPA